MTSLLDVQDLSVVFRTERGALTAVNSVSFDLAAGETLAIVGESGSGKSVTALSLLGLLGEAGRIAGGSIRFDGEDITRPGAGRLREIRGNQITVQAQILELLKSLTRDLNSAMILITHDLGVVARYADRVAVMYAGRIIESAPARDLFAAPSHPYTIGLMGSTPRLASGPKARLATIPGQPPDLAALPSGCAFAPRCPHARELCLSAPPTVETDAGGRRLACYGHG